MTITATHTTRIDTNPSRERSRRNHPAAYHQRLRDQAQSRTTTPSTTTSNPATPAHPVRLTRRGKAVIYLTGFTLALGIGFATAGYNINYETPIPSIESNR